MFELKWSVVDTFYMWCTSSSNILCSKSCTNIWTVSQRFSSVVIIAVVFLVWFLCCNPAQFCHSIRQTLETNCAYADLWPSSSPFHCFNLKGVAEVWRRDYSTSVLRVPTCSLPSMATFVTANKPNFRVTSTRDPAPLISYHTDGWTPAYSQNSMVSTATSHTHEMRASVIMKTSDVTSSWPLTSVEGVSSLLPGHRNDRLVCFLHQGHVELQNLWFHCSFWLGLEFSHFTS